MKPRTLLAQVLAVNLLMVAGTVLVATVVVHRSINSFAHGREGVVLGLGIVATLLGNWLLLRRRFDPLDRLISAMERFDMSDPEGELDRSRWMDSSEVRRLEKAFRRMIARIEAQRREAGWAAIRAQERERRRIAQDLHDEVNQALTAVSLRLQASIEQAPPALRRELTETKRLASQAMEELLTIARQLRPAVLDDHGLLPALHSQVHHFADQTGIRASFHARGPVAPLTPEEQLVVYRVTQESLSNVAQHSGARTVEVELSFVGRRVLAISDDGCGISNGNGNGRGGELGLSGMRERALLVGGQLTVRSMEGRGTRVELLLG
jgi:two-component system, NarL family, sensor histidine kinase UhpB